MDTSKEKTTKDLHDKINRRKFIGGLGTAAIGLAVVPWRWPRIHLI